MSSSPTHKTISAALLAVLALSLAGCGQETSGPGNADQPARDLSGSLAPSDPASAAPQAEPSDQQPAPAPESTDFAPVDIELRGGTFAKGTPRKISVPSGFIVIVSARADQQGPYRLSVLSPSVAQTFRIASGQEKKVTLDSMRAGQSAKLIIGDATVRVVADADPGP